MLCKIANEDVVNIEGTIKYLKENLLYDCREGRFTDEDTRQNGTSLRNYK